MSMDFDLRTREVVQPKRSERVDFQRPRNINAERGGQMSDVRLSRLQKWILKMLYVLTKDEPGAAMIASH